MDDPKKHGGTGDKGGTGGGDDQNQTSAANSLINNVRNVRAILDQARTTFGAETKRQVDGILGAGTLDSSRLENLDFAEKAIGPDAWMYLALVQLTEVVNGIVVQTITPATASQAGAMSGSGR